MLCGQRCLGLFDAAEGRQMAVPGSWSGAMLETGRTYELSK